MDAEQVMRQVTGLVINLKKEKCRDAGGPADLLAQLDVRYPDGSVRIAIPEERELIPVAVEALRANAGMRESFITFFADAYGRSYAAAAVTPHSIERGQLEREFKAGDMDIKEMLVIQVLDCGTGDVLTNQVFYTYRDDGSPKFKQPGAR